MNENVIVQSCIDGGGAITRFFFSEWGGQNIADFTKAAIPTSSLVITYAEPQQIESKI